VIGRLSAWLSRFAAGRSRRFVLVALGVNGLAAVLTVAFLLYVLTRPVGSPTDPPLLILGEEQLQAEAARVGLDEGRAAPGFAADDGTSLGLTDLDGRELDVSDLAGQPVWIVFWATYCHACQEEEPDLRRAHLAHRDDGLVVLAIDAGEPAEDVRRYVEERRLPWRIALDPDLAAFDAYGAIGTPTHYFIDRDGRIASRAFGRLRLDEMESHLAEIMAGTR
jgi:peroxiredoxin